MQKKEEKPQFFVDMFPLGDNCFLWVTYVTKKEPRNNEKAYTIVYKFEWNL